MIGVLTAAVAAVGAAVVAAHRPRTAAFVTALPEWNITPHQLGAQKHALRRISPFSSGGMTSAHSPLAFFMDPENRGADAFNVVMPVRIPTSPLLVLDHVAAA